MKALKMLMIFCALIGIYSCQPALVNFPKMPDCPKIEKQICPTLHKLEVPPQILEDMKLEVKGGNVVNTDKNGVNFLWMYHELRKSIKAQ